MLNILFFQKEGKESYLNFAVYIQQNVKRGGEVPRKKMLIPPASIMELIKKVGAERVSEEAAVALAEYLIEIGTEVAKESVMLARHAGRKTVKKVDIELAISRV